MSAPKIALLASEEKVFHYWLRRLNEFRKNIELGPISASAYRMRYPNDDVTALKTYVEDLEKRLPHYMPPVTINEIPLDVIEALRQKQIAKKMEELKQWWNEIIGFHSDWITRCNHSPCWWCRYRYLYIAFSIRPKLEVLCQFTYPESHTKELVKKDYDDFKILSISMSYTTCPNFNVDPEERDCLPEFLRVFKDKKDAPVTEIWL